VVAVARRRGFVGGLGGWWVVETKKEKEKEKEKVEEQDDEDRMKHRLRTEEQSEQNHSLSERRSHAMIC
jgi:hypothetical protein